jgi:Tfp pilus assembly protein FimV
MRRLCRTAAHLHAHRLTCSGGWGASQEESKHVPAPSLELQGKLESLEAELAQAQAAQKEAAAALEAVERERDELAARLDATQSSAPGVAPSTRLDSAGADVRGGEGHWQLPQATAGLQVAPLSPSPSLCATG